MTVKLDITELRGIINDLNMSVQKSGNDLKNSVSAESTHFRHMTATFTD